MNKVFVRLHGEGVKSTNGSNLKLTAKLFLGKEGDNPYAAPTGFLKFACSLRETEVEQTEQCLQCMKDGLRTIGSIVTRVDKGGRRYTFLNFLKLNATVGFKYILEGGMDQFLKDYMDGKFQVAFTLEELVEEAMNA